jgi:hypothetical protein
VNGLAVRDFLIGWGCKASLPYNSRGHERWDPDIVCRLIAGLVPDAERPERLARKAKPVRAEPVVNLDQDKSFRQMASNNSVHHLLDMPNEVWCVIEFRCHFHLYWPYAPPTLQLISADQEIWCQRRDSNSQTPVSKTGCYSNSHTLALWCTGEDLNLRVPLGETGLQPVRFGRAHAPVQTWRKVDESNAHRSSRCPGFQDQLPAIQQYLPHGGEYGS